MLRLWHTVNTPLEAVSLNLPTSTQGLVLIEAGVILAGRDAFNIYMSRRLNGETRNFHFVGKCSDRETEFFTGGDWVLTVGDDLFSPIDPYDHYTKIGIIHPAEGFAQVSVQGILRETQRGLARMLRVPEE